MRPAQTYASLVDRVVIITGGSRGIGRAIALAFARAGARVAITARRRSEQLEVAAALMAEVSGPGRSLAIAADVRSFAECQAVVAASIDAFGAIHALINNAGLGMQEVRADYPINRPRFWEADPDASRRIVDTNVNGAFNMALAVTPHFVRQTFGKIVNISTSARVLTLAGFAPYGPSKAALESASQIWAEDLVDHGVDVNILIPGGPTDTDMMPAVPGREAYGGGLMPPAVMGPPALWLCSDDSNGLSGGKYVARLWNADRPPREAAIAALA